MRESFGALDFEADTELVWDVLDAGTVAELALEELASGRTSYQLPRHEKKG